VTASIEFRSAQADHSCNSAVGVFQIDQHFGMMVIATCLKAVCSTAIVLGPHALAKQKLWARITDRSVEVFHKGKRVAAHMRGSGNRRHTTVPEHMPSSHRRYANWTPDRIRRDAAANGVHTEILIDVILRSKPHPEQGFRSAIGILRLAKTHGGERLEAACERALEIGARSYSSVASILKNNLDRRTPRQATDGPAIDHPNIRGPQYFH
jgi:transposase